MTAYVNDPDFTLLVGDVRERLRDLEPESVHCVVTSPPYWGLRDYGVAGQLGLEESPDAYVAAMVDVFREVRRVLRPDATVWINLGDSYGTKGSDWSKWKGGQTYSDRDALRGVPLSTGLKPKDLVGMPWRVAFALQADGWWLRSCIIWAKPNPMPESVTDRPTTAHEYVFLLAKSARYFYDADAVREDAKYGRREWSSVDGVLAGVGINGKRGEATVSGGDPSAGRNLRSVWQIATQPTPDAHFATFPEALVEPCIKAGTSERGVCPVCGAPWEREVKREPDDRPEKHYSATEQQNGRAGGKAANAKPKVVREAGGSSLPVSRVETLGWRPSCDCMGPDGDHPGSDCADYDEWPTVPATILDPFLGSGTTALVARRLGRKCVGIELNEEYARLAARRLQQLSLLADGAG